MGSPKRPDRGRKSEFNPASISTAWPSDLLSWGRRSMTLAPTPGTWDADLVGAGAPPTRTDAGRLEIHLVAGKAGRYYLGAMLSEIGHPERIVTRRRKPALEPEADYELAGVYGKCLFSNRPGRRWRQDGDRLPRRSRQHLRRRRDHR